MSSSIASLAIRRASPHCRLAIRRSSEVESRELVRRRHPSTSDTAVRHLSATVPSSTDPQQSWSPWDLLLSSTMALVLSGSLLYNSTTSSSSVNSAHEAPFGNYAIRGGPPHHNNPIFKRPPMPTPEDEDDEDDAVLTDEESAVENEGGSYDVSVRAIKGGRLYMEDNYYVGDGGRFVGVFDGHGGADVSTHLAENLHDRLLQQLPRKKWEHQQDSVDRPTLTALVTALRAAFEVMDEEVLNIPEMQYQGSTAVTVAIHEGFDGQKTVLSANVGDSRAVLCRNGKAVDLTRDHKPDDERERARIHAMGERVEWDNYSKVHRVKNLSLARAIGDSFAKPAVSGEVEIKLFPLKPEDEFIILASDGLWDVMTSEAVVQFVKRKMDSLMTSGSSRAEATSRDIGRRLQDVRRKNMSRYVANEALKRGTADNVCVLIVWLHPLDG